MQPPQIPDLSELIFSRNFLILYAVILTLSIIRSYAVGNVYSSGKDRLEGQRVIITGGFSGIGKASAITLAKLGARVIVAGRSPKSRKSDIDFIKEKCPPDSIVPMELDVSSFKSIVKFVRKYKKAEQSLDILVNNAGIMCHPPAKSEEGHELHFATNFLGPVLLMRGLMDCFNPGARVINLVSSSMSLNPINPRDVSNSTSKYVPGVAFCQSKLALALYSRSLAAEVEPERLSVNCLHPGVVLTGIHRHMGFRTNWLVKVTSYPFCMLLMKYSNSAAEAVAMMAASPELRNMTDLYISGCSKAAFPPETANEEARKAVCEYADGILAEYLEQLN